tara:strand:- start:47 stop:472 length:426 start_codon:yes stop_codon:yes gene_type:complete
MPRLIDKEKERVFIKTFTQTGNATYSARVCGYDSNPRQMGSYLKHKNMDEIETNIKMKLDSMTGAAISTVQNLLNSKSDMCKLKAAEYILKCGGYDKPSASIGSADHEHMNKLSDEELANKIIELASQNEFIMKKLQQKIS